ncbi:MAG: ORF6N domain-containing protein [bacterium]
MLSNQEFANLRSQTVTSSWGGRRKKPYVFTETGVAMLASVLKSRTAVKMNIMIMKAFVATRHFLSENKDLFTRVELIETKLLKDLGKKWFGFSKMELQETLKVLSELE